MNFGLKQRDIDNIQNALIQFPEIEQALVFGSRAKGNSKPGSDIDLAVKGSEVTPETIAGLRSMLNDMPLPYFFDVIDYKAIENKDLTDHIDRVAKTIYNKNDS
ncbi:MAG: nucleotidyltransferase domain-containing protein [Planctomycetes bacterium]|nr:nucleotidyltransferase domain-containing protein [Planctomycetota bacterium]